jgi:hypothetical protein
MTGIWSGIAGAAGHVRQALAPRGTSLARRDHAKERSLPQSPTRPHKDDQTPLRPGTYLVSMGITDQRNCPKDGICRTTAAIAHAFRHASGITASRMTPLSAFAGWA